MFRFFRRHPGRSPTSFTDDINIITAKGKKNPKEKARDFLTRHGMDPPRSDLSAITERMLREMNLGLAGMPSSIAMIPTFIREEGVIPSNGKVIVIDAGGTNLRCSLAVIENRNCTLTPVQSCRMPGTDSFVSWEEFICFTANCIIPVMDQTETIAVCFSYTMKNTPELDGEIVFIDKEVKLNGAVGQLVGASLKKELEKRGIRGKKIVVINDAAAALLGASYYLDRDAYDGFLGQICGTGINTCCLLPSSRIRKLHTSDPTPMYINLESGAFKGFSPGDFDKALNDNSSMKDDLIIEKLIGGGYLGLLLQLILEGAAKEGEINSESLEKIRSKGIIRTVDVDDWAAGEKLGPVTENEDNAGFVRELSLAMIERSAVYTCACLTALMMLTGLGKDKRKPVCICIEGSFAEKGRHFLPMLNELLTSFSGEGCGYYAKTIVGKETTQVGSALAALRN